MADPQALVVAVAAAQALDFVGLPEAQLNLSQAVIHLATAPKSNAERDGDLDAHGPTWPPGRSGEVPAHLRDSHYQGAKVLGHGAGYEYPHDHEGGWVEQTYLPAALDGRAWYRPTDHGHEQEIAETMRTRTAARRSDGAT